MRKITFGPQTALYPMPAFLIGANVEGRPNFMTAAWCSIVNSEPPMLGVGIRPHRHTYRGVKQHGVFSVNVPSIDQLRETDYCGIASGAQEDKVSLCNFHVFYGKLVNAPMILECPVNLECRASHELSLPTHTLFIGHIEETHVSEGCLTEGKPDVDKIKPLVYTSGVQRAYYRLGEMLDHAFRVGLTMKKP